MFLRGHSLRPEAHSAIFAVITFVIISDYGLVQTYQLLTAYAHAHEPSQYASHLPALIREKYPFPHCPLKEEKRRKSGRLFAEADFT